MQQLVLMRKIDKFLTPIYSALPFTHYGITARLIGKKGKTLLDVGCGDGEFMKIINKEAKFEATGVDAFKPYLKKAKETGAYKRLILSDVRKLPFKNERFDMVLCSQVIEHLSRKEGYELMGRLEGLAKKKVIFIAPVGKLPQEAYDENIYQKHKSEWFPSDFERRGYKVVAQGLKVLYGTGNAVKKFGLLSYLFSIVSFLCGPLLVVRPNLGMYMFCWKQPKL